MSVTWTEERTARLRELHAAGWSASQIAADLGGVTRNSIIGKWHRLELTSPRVVIEWTPERDVELRSMADAGLNRTDIAQYFRCNQRTLYTRTKKLGVVVRSNYYTGGAGVRTTDRAPNTSRQRRRKNPFFQSISFVNRPPAPNPFTTKFIDLEDWQCRFPSGDDGDIRFCGGHKFSTSEKTYSYCAEHCQMAYQPYRPPAHRNYARTFSGLRGYA